jgi:flagellar hook-associated protein 2
MVEVSSQVAKPDYLSLVNKGGSGFNISELVDSIVAAEIDPKKTMQSVKKEKNTEAISGIGFLNSKATTSKTALTGVTSDKYFNLSSSNTAAVEFTATDEMRLSPSQNQISDIIVAKKMVFELPGFTDLSSSISQTLTFNFGSWDKTSTAASSASSSVENGKTYKVTTRSGSASTDGNAFDQHTRDPNDSADSDAHHGTPIEVDDVFRASQAFTDNNYTFTELDAYAFTARSGNSATNVTLSGTVENVVKQLDAITGVSAKFVKTSSSGTATYSIVLTSEDTGATNGFQFSAASGLARWTSTPTPSTNANSNAFSQLSKDASLKVDNVSVTRSSNTISDIIDGVEINLKADSATTSQLNVSRSKANVKASVEKIIASMNDFKTELDRLTFIDIEGDNNGPLAMDPTVTRLESNFKKLMIQPLSGYGANGIYLSQLGIKTNSNGNFFFDTANFEKAFTNNPQNFNALKDANLTTSSATASATKSTFTKVDPGIYQVSNDGTNWKFGTTILSRVDYNGGSRFTSISYPGLVIDTVEANPSSFNVYVGKSLSQKVSEFMDTILGTTSNVKTAETTYKTNNTDIAKKIVELEQREALLKSRYTDQFGAMEQAMTQFNSTKTLLENFVEAWKKQK